MELNPSMLTNEAEVGHASGLVDAQQLEIIGPPAGKPSTAWELNAKYWNQFPFSAYLDFGVERHLSSIWLYDTNGKGDVAIGAGTAGPVEGVGHLRLCGLPGLGGSQAELRSACIRVNCGRCVFGSVHPDNSELRPRSFEACHLAYVCVAHDVRSKAECLVLHLVLHMALPSSLIGAHHGWHVVRRNLLCVGAWVVWIAVVECRTAVSILEVGSRDVRQQCETIKDGRVGDFFEPHHFLSQLGFGYHVAGSGPGVNSLSHSCWPSRISHVRGCCSGFGMRAVLSLPGLLPSAPAEMFGSHRNDAFFSILEDFNLEDETIANRPNDAA